MTDPKPFDLKAAIAGAPVVTRAGNPVVFGAHNPHARESCRVMVWIDGSALAYPENGIIVRGEENADDLFMAPVDRGLFK